MLLNLPVGLMKALKSTENVGWQEEEKWIALVKISRISNCEYSIRLFLSTEQTI
jgi:hypothetical protein